MDECPGIVPAHRCIARREEWLIGKNPNSDFERESLNAKRIVIAADEGSAIGDFRDDAELSEQLANPFDRVPLLIVSVQIRQQSSLPRYRIAIRDQPPAPPFKQHPVEPFFWRALGVDERVEQIEGLIDLAQIFGRGPQESLEEVPVLFRAIWRR